MPELKVKDGDATYLFDINDAYGITKITITFDSPLPLSSVLSLPSWRWGAPPTRPGAPPISPPRPPHPTVMSKDGKELCPNCGIPLVKGTCQLGDPVMKCPKCNYMRRIQ